MTRLLPTYTPPGAGPAAGTAATAAPAEVAPVASTVASPAPAMLASRAPVRHRPLQRPLLLTDGVIASPSHPWGQPRRPRVPSQIPSVGHGRARGDLPI